MVTDKLFVAGLCKSQEKNLIGEERLSRLADGSSLDEGIRILREVGFGGDTQIENSYLYENLISYEEKRLISFIKTDCVGLGIYDYALLDNDYHNAEAIIRAKYVKCNLDSMLVVEGKYKTEDLKKGIEDCKYDKFSSVLAKALSDAEKLKQDEKFTGYNLSNLFTKAKYKEKLQISKFDKDLYDATVYEIDCINILTCLRAKDYEYAKNMFLDGGKLREELKTVCTLDEDKIKSTFKMTEYDKAIEKCLSVLKTEEPFVEYENFVFGNTLKIFKQNRFYAVEGDKPIILYYLYKTSEIKNVRAIMVGLAGGIDKAEIKKRLKENYAG